MAGQSLITQSLQWILAIMVQLDTGLAWSDRCQAAMVDPDEWLMILISTLPVKGEESLDLQSPLTASLRTLTIA